MRAGACVEIFGFGNVYAMENSYLKIRQNLILLSGEPKSASFMKRNGRGHPSEARHQSIEECTTPAISFSSATRRAQT